MEKTEERKEQGAFLKICFWIVTVVAVAISLFHIYTAGFGTLTAMKQRSLHLSAMLLIAMLAPMAKQKLTKPIHYIFRGIDLVIAVVGPLSALYIIYIYDALIDRTGRLYQIDIIIGIVLIVSVLWSTYRKTGLPLTIVALVALAYTCLGQHLPGAIGHKAYSAARIVTIMVYSTDGILGAPLGAAATYVVLFIMLTTFLERTGAGGFFINCALALTGRRRGGPAKSAVVASAMFGSISGSAIANVVGTGTFTIPLMKKTGIKSEFSAAVEAVASTGGQFMPPVMGSSAFIMAETTGIPYIDIVKAAFVPAILYYLCLFFVIDAYSAKNGLKGLPKEDMPDIKKEFKLNGHMIIPLLLIFVFLIMGFTPLKAGFYCLLATFLIGFIRKNTRLNLSRTVEALTASIRSTSGVACPCACAGIIVGCMMLTGLGSKLSSLVLSVAHNSLFLTLLLTMLCAIILGMGMPTVASYLILSVMVVPTLLTLGVPKLVAHLFVFYFGITSAITPPVALAAYAGAGIANANAMKTGYTAFRLGITGFVVPYMFVYGQELVMIGTPLNIILSIVSAVIGVFLMACGVEGYAVKYKVPALMRLPFFAAALLMMIPGWQTDLIGVAVGAAAFFGCKLLSDRKQAAAA
ncbi:MAG: TRAP transporter permease [Lachnospiraceae bacterium]|nr:TRAP transporter permease [Lachnospiraceae bacterium]